MNRRLHNPGRAEVVGPGSVKIPVWMSNRGLIYCHRGPQRQTCLLQMQIACDAQLLILGRRVYRFGNLRKRMGNPKSGLTPLNWGKLPGGVETVEF